MLQVPCPPMERDQQTKTDRIHIGEPAQVDLDLPGARLDQSVDHRFERAAVAFDELTGKKDRGPLAIPFDFTVHRGLLSLLAVWSKLWPMPIRLSPTPTTYSMLPFPRV